MLLYIEPYNWSLPINYQPTGILWIYGDSLAVRFSQSVQSRYLCTRLYLGCRHSYNWIYPIISEAVSKTQDDNLDFRPGKVIETIVSVLRRPEMQRKDSVLILNLGLHFPISVNFTTYKRLIGDVVKTLKETEVNSQGIRVPKYKAKVIWKSTTAIHKENAEVRNKTNWRFFTTQVFIKPISSPAKKCIAARQFVTTVNSHLADTPLLRTLAITDTRYYGHLAITDTRYCGQNSDPHL